MILPRNGKNWLTLGDDPITDMDPDHCSISLNRGI